MENASKALLMAGSVLIAIIIIGILIKTGGTISLFQKSKLTEEEQKEIIAYNEQYIKYLNQYVYGTEIITLINKTCDNLYDMKIVVNFIEPYKYTTTNALTGEKQVCETNQLIINASENTYLSFTTSSDAASFRNRAFKCTKINYNSTTGKVDCIEFLEKKRDA